MSEATLHPAPGWGAVAREQFRAVGLATRREWLLFALGLVALTVLLLVSYQRARAEGGKLDFDFTPTIAIPLMFLGFVAPFSVWKGMEPSRRGYLWALPVERGGHTLLRSFHGWLWFMALIAAYLLWALAMAWVTGGDLGVERQRVLLADMSETGRAVGSTEHLQVVLADPASWRELRWVVPAWMWAVPFVAGTATYLLGSIVVLASDHPWRWFAGILVGFFLLLAVSEAAELKGLKALLETVFGGRWGMEMLIEGTHDVAQTFTNRAGEVVQRNVERPALGRWLATAALWLGIGTAGTLLAGLRHQER